MDEQWKKSLRRAVDQLPAPDVQELWNQPVTQMVVHDHITRQEPLRPSRRAPRRGWQLAAIAACLLLSVVGGGIWYRQTLAVHVIVELDVNPSIELTVSRQEKVLSVEALNAEAALLLEGANYRGWEVDDAVEALADRLRLTGYLQETENAVLLTVSGTDSNLDELARELSETILESADRAETPTTVLRQTARKDQQLREQAKEYHVSSGKLRLAAALGDSLPQYSLSQLLELPMETLLAALRQESTAAKAGLWVDATRYPPPTAPAPADTSTGTASAVAPPSQSRPHDDDNDDDDDDDDDTYDDHWDDSDDDDD